MTVRLSILMLLLALPSFAWAEPAADAVHRGSLSLAWDAHDSGLCEEALAYLTEIPDESSLAPSAAWLRAECWYDLGEYTRAAAALTAPVADEVEGRDGFLFDIYWHQAWDATAREQYDEALRVLAEALRTLPGDPDLEALAAATRYRQGLVAGLREAAAPADAAWRLPGEDPPGRDGWVRAHPWRGESDWVPRTTAEDWMPSVVTRARQERRELWVRLEPQALAGEVVRAASDAGLALRRESWGWSVGRAGEWVPVEGEEWRFRGVVEGLGVRGAALAAVRRASAALADQESLVDWVVEHRGELAVSRLPEGLQLIHPDSGRRFLLDPLGWAEAFHGEPEEWQELWRDLTTELGRSPRPYRCFCGRPVVLREVLMGDPGQLVVVGREDAVAVVVVALCTEHLRYVDQYLTAEWKVSPGELVARARIDARDSAWQLTFGRGDIEGVSYLYLEGEGVSSLVRTPDLLLGALERVEGYGVRGTTVRVFAASGSTLVVAPTDAPESLPREAAARLLQEQARHGDLVAGTRLEYRATLRLPGEPRGTFRLTPVE